MVAKFHEKDILGEILDAKSEMNQANKKSMKISKAEERECIMDVYNYAARFDAVPKVSIMPKTRKGRRNARPNLELIVEFPEQGICVKSEGRDLHSVEVRAAKMFKEMAEKYQKEHSSETIVIKGSGALTSDIASKFMDFYKIARRGVDIQIECTQSASKARHLGKNLNRVQVKINGEVVGEPVEMWLKKQAEELAVLSAAIVIKKREPELYPRFLRALETGNGQILKPLAPVSMYIDQDCSLSMRETLLGARMAGLPDAVKEAGSQVVVSESQRRGFRRSLTGREAQQRDQILQQKMKDFLSYPNLSNLRDKKAELPMNQYRAQVLDLVNNNVYSIIVGATGSGKSTQVPQILLDDAISKGKGSSCNVVCTQPRRIAAISVAKRVAEERAETLQDSVGYQVRYDSKPPQIGGSVTYCTTGILQQQLQHNPDEVMDNVSHLVIDEVHERDMLIDFLLILLRKNIKRRQALGKSNPQVVLMSATLNTELFASYFQSDIPGKGTLDCPSLSVPGRTFPVKERYLEEILKELNANSSTHLKAMYTDPNTKDYLNVETHFRTVNPITNSPELADESRKDLSVIDWRRERTTIDTDGLVDPAVEKENSLIPLGLIACTIAHITRTSQEGAILVFLPGLSEIVKVEKALKNEGLGVDFNNAAKFKLCLLHSTLPAGQNTVFDPVPQGCRKIILATNIAETSITIPDVQYVVDTGKLREKQFDQTRRLSQLSCTWISKSNSKQRAGRAGRVQNGNYYALFTEERYQTLRAVGLPEILRTDLQEICLQIKAQAIESPIREFLAEAIEPPNPKAVDAAIFKLEALDAITEDGEAITPLGRLLSSFPVHPSLGKMIILGIIFRCLDPMIVLGAAGAERSLFNSPIDHRNEAIQAKVSFAQGSGSDHIALLNAVQELRQVRDNKGEYWMRDVAHRNFLNLTAFNAIEASARQIEQILLEARLIPPMSYPGGTKPQLGGVTLNENSHKLPLIKALILAGLHPNLAINNGGLSFRTLGEKSCFVHSSSLHASFGIGKGKKGAFWLPKNTLFMYSNMVRANDSNSLFIRDVSEATPLIASLFGGKLKQHEARGNIIELDNWLPFYVTSPDRRSTKIVIEFRKSLERLMVVAFNELGKLASRARRPGQGEQETFFADDKVRKLFAAGLVDVLDRDARVTEDVAKKGWSGQGTPRSGFAEGPLAQPGPRTLAVGRDRPVRGPQAPSRARPGGRSTTPMPSFYVDLMQM